jgi:hypothetical protein
MDKKKVIAEVIKLANDFENNGMVSIANKVTDIALKLAYDFKNPKKEEIVDESLALEDEDITHWNDDEDSDDSDDSDKVDFSNIFKELLVDDSLTKDFAFDDDEEDMDDSDDSDDDDLTSFDEENENIDKDTGEPITENEWNDLFQTFIVDGDISRSQIEDALSVLINSSKKLAKYNGHTSSLVKLACKHYDRTNHIMNLKEIILTMDKTFGRQMDLL